MDDLKKYYLRNELVWRQITDDQVFTLQEEGVIEINGKSVRFAPRIAAFRNDGGFVEMYEVSDLTVFLNSILDGVVVRSGETGNAVGMPTVTMPVNVVYAVRAVVSPTNYYFNNRFFPNIEDAVSYYNNLKRFIIEKQNDAELLATKSQQKAVETEG